MKRLLDLEFASSIRKWSSSWNFQFLSICFIIHFSKFHEAGVYGAKIELEGPSLTSHPNPVTYFSNSVGVTISCLGKGLSPLSISWLNQHGEPLQQITGFREVLGNGSLFYNPFRFEEYRADIHNSQIQCSVTNPVGTFLSPFFNIRAILDTPFELFITGSDENEMSDGNPVVLKCNISPTSYSEFVSIISWKSLDQFGYQTPISSDSKSYQMTSSGSLIIFSLNSLQELYVCVAQNRLNKKTQSSSPFLLKSSSTQALGLPPKNVGQLEHIIETVEGKSFDLVCSATGSSPLHFRVVFIPAEIKKNKKWEKEIKVDGRNTNINGKLPVLRSRTLDVFGPILSFQKIDRFHNGTYRCEVTNNFGTLSLEFHVLVKESLKVYIEPPKRKNSQRFGSSIDLNCKIHYSNNQNLNSDKFQFIWYKNGREIVGFGNRVKVTDSKLSILNSQLEDQGVYQCFVSFGGGRDELNYFSETYYAATDIIFEATSPELHSTFISQSLQPGPTVSLKCSSVGNPFPNIQWYVDGEEIFKNEPKYWDSSDRYSIIHYKQLTEIVSHLNITSVRVEDSGSYSCISTNLLGSVSHSSRLNVFGPLFVKEMRGLTLVADEAGLLPCTYGGYPVDKISWERVNGGKSEIIPPSFSNGTLRIEKLRKETDSGTYRCNISNRKGESASGALEISIMYPPVISSFAFDENLIEGQRTSATCNVVSGDLPIKIQWLKDNEIIPESLNITEMRVKFLSYLIFETLDRKHSGTYTCSASNAASTQNSSAILTIKVPPYWVQEPEDTRVILKGSHIIPCSANGVPKPTIKWYRETGSSLRVPVDGDRKIEVLSDGSLKIEEAESLDSSTYICEADNGIGIGGKGLSKSIRIHVNIPAKVSAPESSVITGEGVSTTLKCQIRGDEPIDVEWRKEDSSGFILQNSQNNKGTSTRLSQINHHPKSNSTFFISTLSIERTEQSDSGIYLCIASNAYGRDEQKISLLVKARPQAPTNLAVEEIGSRFIKLKWSTSPLTPSSVLILFYIVQFKKSSIESWTEAKNTSINYPQSKIILEPLSPTTNYDLRLFSSNDIGQSVPTEPITVLTLPEAPSGPALNISAVPLSSKTVKVKWEPPNPIFQHGTILGYQIFATLQSSSQFYTKFLGGVTNNSIMVDEKWGTETELSGLRPNSQYRISIRAYNSAGIGPDSPFVYVHTPEGVPDSPPQNIQCESLSSKSLHIQWDPPPSHLTNGNVHGYKVIYQSVQDLQYGEKPEVKKTSNRETTLHGLQSFTNYSVKTLAFTLGGEGSISESIFCLTEQDTPGEVPDLKVFSTSSSSVLVSWLSPNKPNGVITKYIVYWKPDENVDKESNVIREKVYTPQIGSEEEQMHLEIKRLRENGKYSFWITASTIAGTGKPSKTINVALSSKISSKIASFPVRRSSVVEQSLVLTCKTIGVPQGKVSWFHKNRMETSHHLMRNGSLFISRLKDGDEGQWTCRVENSLGTDEIIHEIVISRPPSSVPLFLGYVSSSSIQVHWDSPERQDPPVTGYILYYKREDGSSTSSKLKEKDGLKPSSFSSDWQIKRMNAKGRSFTLENLSCGSFYLIKIYGENSIGLSPPSSLLRGKTNGEKPDAEPKLNEILFGNETMIGIDLSSWADGGCALKNNFQIEYRQKDAVAWQRIYRKENVSRRFYFNTVPHFIYEVKIVVENDVGVVSKLFQVKSDPDFFLKYEKEKGRVAEERSSGDSFLKDPHVVVPIVSAVICTCAIALCALILLKRRSKNRRKDEWKFAHSSTQQTWVTSEDGSKHENTGNNSNPNQRGGNMSIYATLNSSKAIPVEIRDSTLRFQTFGQRDNYDAAPPPAPPNPKKSRGSKYTHPNFSPTDLGHEVRENDYGLKLSKKNVYRGAYDSDSDDDDTEDSLKTGYARPYQLTAYRRGKADKFDISGNTGGTLKKKQISRNRATAREYIE